MYRVAFRLVSVFTVLTLVLVCQDDVRGGLVPGLES